MPEKVEALRKKWHAWQQAVKAGLPTANPDYDINNQNFGENEAMGSFRMNKASSEPPTSRGLLQALPATAHWHQLKF